METNELHLQPLRFRDPRQLNIYQRLSHIGEGPASFYRDACQLRDGQLPLAALTHFIAHSLREVESALRDVLLPYNYTPPDVCQTCENRPEGHKKEIEAIARAYGFEEQLKKEWIRLIIQQDKKGGLARYAHRDALARPRDYNEQFEQVCDDFDHLLEHLLNKFEAQFAQVFPRLDLLLHKDEPTREDLIWLKNSVPSNFATYSYFFDKLNSYRWLAPLNRKGFFKHLPREEYDPETGRVSFSPWPQSHYLARMANARAAQDTVLEIVLEIAHTKNFYVRVDVVEVALALPARKTIALLPMIHAWLEEE